jgi:hypothetical protein
MTDGLIDLNAAARACLAGAISRVEYYALWSSTIRTRVSADVLPLVCGHVWADGQRVWADGSPSEAIRCRVGGHDVAEVAEVGPDRIRYREGSIPTAYLPNGKTGGGPGGGVASLLGHRRP